MSFLTTRSSFFYGFTVTRDNQNIDFNEGGSPLLAVLNIGAYSATEFVAEIKRAMDAAGALTYTVTFNRSTRKITIAATGTFALLCNSGSHVGSSPWTLSGFSTASDKTAAATYTGENVAGSEYRPQAVLKDYISPDHFKLKEFARVNVATDGTTQMVDFGTTTRFQGNIWQVTDRTVPTGATWETQASAISNTISFLDFLITKGKVEFMPDRATPATFHKAILERTEQSGNGTQYQLQEFDAKDFYQTGRMVFRVLA